MSATTANRPGMTAWIMLAVLIWGLLLALGSFLFGGNLPLWRAGIVVAVTVGFLGLWAIALAARKRREREANSSDS